jgi:predicted transcriptional regulator
MPKTSIDPLKTMTTTIRLPRYIKVKLQNLAFKKDRSVNWIVNGLIKEGLEKQ